MSKPRIDRATGFEGARSAGKSNSEGRRAVGWRDDLEFVWFCAPASGGEGWVFDPGQVSAIAVVAALYVRGSRRVALRGGSVPWTRHAAFGLGVALLLVALISPLHFASANSLSAHMLQHTLLLLAPLPLVLSKVNARVLQGLPNRLRGKIARLAHPLIKATHPVVALIVVLVLVVAWHAPPLLEVATANPALHIFQHISLVGAAALYWTAILRHRKSLGVSLASIFVLLLVGGAAGALITFSSVPLYSGYAARSIVMGSDWQLDQQMAGLVMWLPMGLVLMALAGWLAYQWAEGVSRSTANNNTRDSSQVEPPGRPMAEPQLEARQTHS
jgi:putative membrane protein